jgi:hypothetical protein
MDCSTHHSFRLPSSVHNHEVTELLSVDVQVDINDRLSAPESYPACNQEEPASLSINIVVAVDYIASSYSNTPHHSPGREGKHPL